MSPSTRTRSFWNCDPSVGLRFLTRLLFARLTRYKDDLRQSTFKVVLQEVGHTILPNSHFTAAWQDGALTSCGSNHPKGDAGGFAVNDGRRDGRA